MDERSSPTRDATAFEDESSQTLVSATLAYDPDRPLPGTILEERYEVGKLLGHGGMGYVLAARHVILGTRLALKVLHPEMSRDPEMIERFRREARAASAIGHPNIVEVRDFGQLPSRDGGVGASYFVMEHLEGVGLADALATDGPFSVERAIDVVTQMADALEAAHAQGIIHRDVKPENVILTTRNGRPDHVKILDFGIAKLDSAVQISGAFRVLGTPAYMSPEQAQGRVLDARADLYSLAIVLYELLTGGLPFDHPNTLELLRMQVMTPAPSVLEVRPDVPDVIAATLAAALEKNRDARPASMRAFVEMLAPFAEVRSGVVRRGTRPSWNVPALTDRTSVDAAPRVSPIPTRISPQAEVRPSFASAETRSGPVASPPASPVTKRSRFWVAGFAVAFALALIVGVGLYVTRSPRAPAALPAPGVPSAQPVELAVEDPPVEPEETREPEPASVAEDALVAPVVEPVRSVTRAARTPRAERSDESAPLDPPAVHETPVPRVEVARPTAQVIDPWE